MPRPTSTIEEPRQGIELQGTPQPRGEEVLTPAALKFVAALHRRFDKRRLHLLAQRRARQHEADAGNLPGFLPQTASIREDTGWSVAPIPEGLLDRRVEITGPVERKMMINALNSGARVFMADFEDSNSPTWENTVQGQVNLLDYTQGKLRHTDPRSGKEYEVGAHPATLVVRVRGLHLDEAHVVVDGERLAAAFFDFGLHFFHNAKRLPEIGLGPWYYLPKLEHHEEARLWDDVFRHAQEALGVPVGTIKATCLIETLPAVFQMDEILYALREHAAGLNAGRWDYMFSCIKVCRNHPEKVLPDRAQVTMTVPFMRAYTELLVRTCHRRGAFAMGGMSAFIPNRRDPQVTQRALAAVRADKEREAADGCDGTWVAHPDLVAVATEIFDARLGERPNQLHRLRDDVEVREAQLLDFAVPGGRQTRAGLTGNIEVALRYLEAWLSGVGAVAINDLMEDAATAEISRSQVWQWVRNGVVLEDGTKVTARVVEDLIAATAERLGASRDAPHLKAAADLLRRVALDEDFPEFLTIAAYDILTKETRK